MWIRILTLTFVVAETGRLLFPVELSYPPQQHSDIVNVHPRRAPELCVISFHPRSRSCTFSVGFGGMRSQGPIADMFDTPFAGRGRAAHGQ